MNHEEHVFLLQKGFQQPGGIWADLGSGGGAFTLALAQLIGPDGIIYSLDRDGNSLRRQAAAMRRRFPQNTVHYIQADFSKHLELPPLDGLVMANALHFVRRKEPLVRRIRRLLKQNGRFILVEYNVDRGNPWVPHPLSAATWSELALRCGFEHVELLATRPSRFLGEIYSMASW